MRDASQGQGQPGSRSINLSPTFKSMDPREALNYLRRNKDHVADALSKAFRNGRFGRS
jgi:hypothetical protein